MRSRCLATAVAAALTAAACAGGSAATPAATTTTDPSTATSSTSDAPDQTTVDVAAQRPAAPVGLTVVGTDAGTIELAWDASRSGDVIGYEITRVGRSGSAGFEVVGNTFTDSDLDENEIFTYTVVAVGLQGKSERSEAVTAQVGVDSNPPTTPGRPRILQSPDAAVSLEWDPSRDVSGVAHYVVRRTIGDDTDELIVDEPFLVDDIDAGLVVTYAVVAVDNVGNASEPGRRVTLLSGRSTDVSAIVVSAIADPTTDTNTNRFNEALLDAGFTVSWFEDDVFDSNLTSSGDVVVLLGDVEAEGFDWNIFGTDATVIGLKSMFVQAGGITENPPKLDRLAQLIYTPPGAEEREVPMTTTGRPKPVVYIPELEQLPSLQVWARPVWSDEIAVAGLISAGGELADEKPAKGCRAFFPGNSDSLSEQTDDAWDLLIEFVGEISDACP